jgi:DNA polymerase-3 subunit delta'
MLRTAVAADRLAHACLFVGPRGVGKGLVARELAKLLLCKSPRGSGPDDLDPCDSCDVCRRVDRGTHPDLYWFQKDADKNDFSIEIVARREKSPPVVVTEAAMLTPMEGERTITVLDGAELLNQSAANALLKTLEEPSSRALIILLCSDATRLPGTVLSRCQWVRFVPLPAEFVARKVHAVLSREPPPAAKGRRAPAPAQRTASEAEIAFVCRFAGGSIEQAVQLTGSGLWDLKRRTVSSLPALDAASALDAAAAAQDWGKTLAKEAGVKAESPEANAWRRMAARTLLAVVASAFADAALVQAGLGDAPALANADQRDVVDALASWPAAACARAVDLLADAQRQVGRYVHTELATENALLQVSRLRPAPR